MLDAPIALSCACPVFLLWYVLNWLGVLRGFPEAATATAARVRLGARLALGERQLNWQVVVGRHKHAGESRVPSRGEAVLTAGQVDGEALPHGGSDLMTNVIVDKSLL